MGKHFSKEKEYGKIKGVNYLLEDLNMEKSIIFLHSYHHMNTQKICTAIATKINALIINVNDKKESIDLDNYNIIGFGAGIDSGKHYPQMIEFVKNLPNVQNKKAFIFSTSAIYSVKKMTKDHKTLREILQNKGFVIVKEFSCKGFNTNSFLKYLGGMNKGHPNIEDIKNAEIFAEKFLKL